MSKPDTPEPADIAKSTEAAAIEKFQGPIDGVTSPCGTWIKVKATYDDRWQTPMAGAKFNLYLNSELLLAGKHLKDYQQVGLKPGEIPPKDAAAKAQWQQKYDELGTFYYPSCDEGKAYFEIVSDPSAESQIQQLDSAIESALDGAYRNVEAGMSGYREQWQTSGKKSLLISIGAGAKEGASDIATGISQTAEESYDWVTDKDNWFELWQGTKEAASKGSDWAQASLKDAWYFVENTSVSEVMNQAAEQVETIGNAALDSIEESIEKAQANVEQVQKIYQHREALLNLPNHIVAADVNEIEAFIDTTLQAIDPEWAEQLRYDKSWQDTLELVNYRQSTVVFIAYAQQFFAAVPPNFYTFYFGKGGVFVLYEIILFVIGMLLGGIGAAARVSVITARIARMSGSSTKAVKNAQQALSGFSKMIESFAKAGDRMAKQAPLITKARRAETKDGVAGNTVEKQRAIIKNNKNCRICNSDKHTTPVSRKGNLEYNL
ncbi:hypothetical protein WN093_14095 [Gammaproteobacteria bacterium AS21]